MTQPTDEQPTNPPADPPKPPDNPPTPQPTPDSSAEHQSSGRDDGPILAAIGELKNMITGAIAIGEHKEDVTPARKPWFARGGRS